MPLVRYAAQATAWNLGSNLSNNFVQYFNIGSGSGTFVNTQVTLLNETDRNPITGSPDFTSARKVSFQGDFNSVELSGTVLFEWGLIGSHPSLQGSIWQRETFGSIVYDGTGELQLVSTIEIII